MSLANRREALSVHFHICKQQVTSRTAAQAQGPGCFYCSRTVGWSQTRSPKHWQLHRCLRSHLRSHFYTPCAQPSTVPGRRVRDQQAKRLWVLPLGSKVGAHLAGDALVPFRAGCSWDTTRPPIPSKRHWGASSSTTLY